MEKLKQTCIACKGDKTNYCLRCNGHGFTTFTPFTEGYLKALFFCEEGEDNLKDKGLADFDADTLDEIKTDCEDFQKNNADILNRAYATGYSPESAGHDFWLTRCGHGAGYWDRGLGDIGDSLTKASNDAGGYNVYLGEDGKIYGSS